jgi:hypothetical protein
MVYLIDPQDVLSGKPCKTFCELVCSTLCVTRTACAIKPLYGIDT